MKILRIIFFVLIAIVAIASIIPAFMSSTINVSRSITIDAPAADVYAVLTDFNQSEHWDPWIRKDPDIETTVTGEGADSVYTWDGTTVGAGELTFIELVEPTKIRVQIKMFKPMEDQFEADWNLRDAAESPDAPKTLATWSMDSSLTYFERYFGPMIEGMIIEDYDQGLANLKKYVEGKQKPDSPTTP